MSAENLWEYIRERERIRQSRLVGNPWPWTTDPILQKYKFTNVKRANDKTTQWFIANWYKNNLDCTEYEALYNCAVARYHGTIRFAQAVGWQADFYPVMMTAAAREIIASGGHPYTGAYIVTNGGRHGFKETVVCEFLKELWEKRFEICDAISITLTWEAGYKRLIKVAGFGGSGFMAKEVLQDYILWRRLAGRPDLSDELSWTPVGPGGRRGLNRLSGRPLRFQQAERKFVAEIVALQQILSPRYEVFFNEKLTAHDVQFCCCEFDKYERVRLAEGRCRSLYHPPE